MNIKFQKFSKSAEIFGTICGGLLISVSAISQTAVAQRSTPSVNPCPSIFYEEPHNNQVVVPQGCPPNAITNKLTEQGVLPLPPTVNTSAPSQTGLGVGGETPLNGTSKVNPCPRIYYEEPFNSRNIVPQGCPPNGLSERESYNQVVPVSSQDSTETTTTTQTPFPSQQQSASATIALSNGRLDIKLINNTGATITYQVIGDTKPRSLPGKSNVMLQSINAPVTVTFQREDGGLLTATPQTSSGKPGMLEVTLNAATDLAQDTKALRIERNGSVFLN